MAYDLTGKLHEIFDEQQVSEKFRKREFVLEDASGQYPEHIKFQLVQDKCSLLDRFILGDEVKVSFALRGRGFSKNGSMMYFTNLEAWRIEAAGTTPNRAQQPAAPRAQPAAAPIASDDDNDLPF